MKVIYTECGSAVGQEGVRDAEAEAREEVQDAQHLNILINSHLGK